MLPTPVVLICLPINLYKESSSKSISTCAVADPVVTDLLINWSPAPILAGKLVGNLAAGIVPVVILSASNVVRSTFGSSANSNWPTADDPLPFQIN